MKVTQAELARKLGVSKPTITEHKKNKSIVVDKGGKFDSEHPVNRAWLKARGYDTGFVQQVKKEPEIPEDLEGFPTKILDTILREAVPRMGGIAMMDLFAQTLHRLLQSEEKETRNRKLRGLLVERDLVRIKVGTFLHELANGLFDMVDNLVPEFIAIARSSQAPEVEIKALWKKELEYLIESAKAKSKEAMK